MAASDVLSLIAGVAALVAWVVFTGLRWGPGAWRLTLLGAFLIGAVVSLVASALAGQPGVEQALLAVLHGGCAALVVGGVQLSLWLREKGAERRARGENGGG